MIGSVVLGRYRIVRPLAKGGMGVVYLARHEGASGFARPVVVKRMVAELMGEDTMTRMFKREAQLMSMLRHPGVVGVLEFGEEDGAYLMGIEYVHGFHLGQWARFYRKIHGPFLPEVATHIVIKVLEALHYAHELHGEDGEPLGIVHRDVSPSNVLIDVEGHVKLADFGIARSREHTEHTEENTIKGKMPYLAPELFRRGKPSGATDTYACAVVLHELLLGYNEFRGPDVATTVSRVLELVPQRLDQVRDDVPRALGEVIATALGKDPTYRYKTAEEFARALREARGTSDEVVNSQVKKLIKRDFLDARISDVLEVPSLSELEGAWKRPPDTRAASSPMRIRTSTSAGMMMEAQRTDPTAVEVAIDSPRTERAAVAGIPALARNSGAMPVPALTTPGRQQPVDTGATKVEVLNTPEEIPVPMPMPTPSRVPRILATIGLLAAAVTGGVLAWNNTNGQSTPERPYYVVSGTDPNNIGTRPIPPPDVETHLEPAIDAELEQEVTEDAAVAEETPDAGGAQATKKNPGNARRSRSAELTRTFQRRGGALVACFNGHQVDGEPSLQIQMSVDEQGHVTAARVTPAEINGTPLGACLREVATTTEFPPGDAVNFGIPLSIRPNSN